MEKKKEFVIDFAYYACIIFLVYLFGKYMLNILLPFIIGFVIALFIRRLSIRIFKTPGEKRLIPMLFVFYVLLAFIISILSVLVVNGFSSIDYAGLYSNFIEPAINILYQKVSQLNQGLPENIASILNQATTALFDTIKNVLLTISTYLINVIKNIVVSLPNAIISVTVTIVSSCYFAQDYDKIIAFGKKVIPSKWLSIINNLVEFIQGVLLKIIGSYLEIMGITCLELFIGLLVLGVPNSFLLAILIAILDILPILGVGTALIPWACIELVFGNVIRGLGLLVLYTIITVIRNIIEPRMVGTNLGLTPLITLLGMMIGLGLFGIVGMFGIPLITAFILYLRKKEEVSVE